MMQFDRITLGRQAKELGFVRDTFEKVCRLVDSFVYEYVNAGGVKDNIKIEINYMLRCHVFPTSHREVVIPWEERNPKVLCVDPIEIFSTKAVALINRSAARDLYDMFNLQKSGLIDESCEGLFRKCIMFYSAIGSETVPKHFEFGKLGDISLRKIRTDLTPVLRRAEHFDLAKAQEDVRNYLERILLPEDDTGFWEAFAKGEYKPELLFSDAEILTRIEKHPMALWKCNKNVIGT